MQDQTLHRDDNLMSWHQHSAASHRRLVLIPEACCHGRGVALHSIHSLWQLGSLREFWPRHLQKAQFAASPGKLLSLRETSWDEIRHSSS